MDPGQSLRYDQTMTYAIAEIFKSLQGEGINAGRSAVFVRFAGCNLWTGKQEHRERDAIRHGASCPRFCDTDFSAKLHLDIDGVEEKIRALLPADIVVFTGGEPMLQLDTALIERCKVELKLETSVETNGTVIPADPRVLDALDHICVSPKRHPSEIVLRRGTELKVVFPAYSPRDYEVLAQGFTHWLVSPEAQTMQVGKSVVQGFVEKRAAEWCMKNRKWRLSLQLHKHLELP